MPQTLSLFIDFRMICAAVSAFLLVPAGVFGESITLKSGKEIEAPILEETPDYIKVEYQGQPVYYERRYIRSIENSPVDSNSFLNRGLAYAAEGNFDMARDSFHKGLDIDPANENIIGAMSILNDLKKEKVDPQYVQNFFRGSAALSAGNFQEACVYLRKALEVSPDDLDVNYNLAVAYQALDDHAGAIQHFGKVLEKRPDDADVFYLLSSSYFATGRIDEARQSLLTAKTLFVKKGDTEGAEAADYLLEAYFPD